MDQVKGEGCNEANKVLANSSYFHRRLNWVQEEMEGREQGSEAGRGYWQLVSPLRITAVCTRGMPTTTSARLSLSTSCAAFSFTESSQQPAKLVLFLSMKNSEVFSNEVAHHSRASNDLFHLLFFLLTYEVANHPCLSLKLNLGQLFAYFRLIGKERTIDLHRLFIFCFYFHIIVDSYGYFWIQISFLFVHGYCLDNILIP